MINREKLTHAAGAFALVVAVLLGGGWLLDAEMSPRALIEIVLFSAIFAAFAYR